MKTNVHPTSSPKSSAIVPHRLVAERAYAIWLAKGQPGGCDYDHWVQAERQLLRATPPEPSLASRLAHWNDPLSTDIDRALAAIASTSAPRSATSL